MTSIEKREPRLAYAGNRKIGSVILQRLVTAGLVPVALILPRTADEPSELPDKAPSADCFQARDLSTDAGLTRLRSLQPDYLISVHYPHILPQAVLAIPAKGALNLHPAYLPFNRGWHTPSWAIWEGTPYGATLHWMDEGVDTGPIALQREIQVLQHETADQLYQRVLELEVDVFEEAIPLLREGNLPRIAQPANGTSHKKTDLAKIQNLAGHHPLNPTDVIRLIRALSTSEISEAAYWEEGDARYYARLDIVKQPRVTR